MEILRIHIQLGETLALDSFSAGIRMIPFTGTCESSIFTGKVLPGGMDTQVFPEKNRGTLSARYMLEGVDGEGKSCKMFIENNAVMENGRETVTFPSIKTDSEALKWLEAADLTGALQFREDGLDIVISSEDRPGVSHIALKRGGLTLRGVLEKPEKETCPLVLMLHGFGADSSIFNQLTAHLVPKGYACLRFDFNGHGNSEGAFPGMTVWNELEDAAAFLQYAMNQAFVSDIYVVGHSQGGVVAGLLAGTYPDVVKKLALLAPAASLKTDAQEGHCMWAHYDTNHIPPSVKVDEQHEVGGLYFRLAKNLPIYEITGKYQNKALVMFGGQDEVVKKEAAEKYKEGFENGEFCFYPTLHHGLGGEEQMQMAEKLVAFLTE